MTSAPDRGGREPGFGRLREAAIDLLTGWIAPDAEQEALRRAYLEHLAAHPGACAKAGPPAHLIYEFRPTNGQEHGSCPISWCSSAIMKPLASAPLVAL